MSSTRGGAAALRFAPRQRYEPDEADGIQLQPGDTRRQPAQPQIRPAVQDRPQDPLGGAVEQGEANPGMPGPERAEQGGQEAFDRGQTRGERDSPARLAVPGADFPLQGVRLLQEPKGPGIEFPAAFGQGGGGQGPVEEGTAELVLQLAHLGAHRGLGSEQAHGGPGESPFPHDLHEAAQGEEIHGHSLRSGDSVTEIRISYRYDKNNRFYK